VRACVLAATTSSEPVFAALVPHLEQRLLALAGVVHAGPYRVEVALHELAGVRELRVDVARADLRASSRVASRWLSFALAYGSMPCLRISQSVTSNLTIGDADRSDRVLDRPLGFAIAGSILVGLGQAHLPRRDPGGDALLARQPEHEPHVGASWRCAVPSGSTSSANASWVALGSSASESGDAGDDRGVTGTPSCSAGSVPAHARWAAHGVAGPARCAS